MNFPPGLSLPAFVGSSESAALAQRPCPFRRQIPAAPQVGATRAAGASQRRDKPSEAAAGASWPTRTRCAFCALVRVHACQPGAPSRLCTCQHGCERACGGRRGGGEQLRTPGDGFTNREGNVASRATDTHARVYSSLLPPQPPLTGLGWNHSLLQTGNFLKWLNTQLFQKRKREEKSGKGTRGPVIRRAAGYRCVATETPDVEGGHPRARVLLCGKDCASPSRRSPQSWVSLSPGGPSAWGGAQGWVCPSCRPRLPPRREGYRPSLLLAWFPNPLLRPPLIRLLVLQNRARPPPGTPVSPAH